MAGESTTHCDSKNNKIRGLEAETGDVLVTPETLRLQLPADSWGGSAGLYCTSLPFSCKMCFLDFAPVEVVPKRPNKGFGGSTS
jgi:hypothetical protein